MAEQSLVWDGNMHPAIEFWMGDAFQSWAPTARELDFLSVDGVVTAHQGDRITKSADGDFRVEGHAAF